MTHTLHRLRRNLQDLQHITTVGRAGKKPGNPKLFSNLLVAALREKLCARGQHDFGKKADMRKKLDDILCGVQRVSTLLLLDPQQPLGRLDLDQYTVQTVNACMILKGTSVIFPRSYHSCWGVLIHLQLRRSLRLPPAIQRQEQSTEFV